MSPAGDLFLVAEHTLERAGKLRDKDRDGVVPDFQISDLNRASCFSICY